MSGCTTLLPGWDFNKSSLSSLGELLPTYQGIAVGGSAYGELFLESHIVRLFITEL
tara:strand:- start:220 stop:387 length:168 start_codon:yes stop_codon:yes gene_type:complete